MSVQTAQLLVYRFGPDADFEGRLVGALERIEAGAAVKIVDGVFVASDPESGELVAIDLGSNGAGGIVASLLSFRHEPVMRRRATEQALTPHGSGLPAETLRRLGGTLGPGEALLAILLQHAWAIALEDAVARTGGIRLVSEFVGDATLANLAPDLLVSATRAGAST